MKRITKHHKKLRFAYIKVVWFALFLAGLTIPNYTKLESNGYNFFEVTVNGVYCGSVDSAEKVDGFIQEARRAMAINSSELVFMDCNVNLVGKEIYYGSVDDEAKVKVNIYEAMKATVRETRRRSYTVKVNEMLVNLASYDDVYRLLNAAIDQYDTEHEFEVTLNLDPNRELTVLVPEITKTVKEVVEEPEEVPMEAGIGEYFTEVTTNLDKEKEELDWSDFELGFISVDYQQSIEVVEAYVPQDELIDVDTAIALVTQNQEVQQTYTIQSGDTLSEISINYGIPIAELIAMNPDKLESENSTIHIDDELIITIPEPALSIIWQEELYYEEEYNADVIYVDNDDWYTTQQVTLQEPCTGYRKVVARHTYRNEELENVEILKEEIVMDAVPKIVERGTKTPPTYVKPISGGRLSSGFGGRNAPVPGASTNHKGVDWSIPIGTPVAASSSGRVERAGWLSGYGYAVYINHPDGRQTRYAHLSKIYVSAGQYVKQGQIIAASGNTGRSSGPHLHFEILIGGKQVNPLNYLN